MRAYLPAHGRDVSVSGVEVSEDPDTQVAQVISMMLDYSGVDGESSELQYDAEAAALPGDPLTGNFYDVKRRLRFVQDDETALPFTSSFPRGSIVETLVRPIDMRVMRDPQGDCDDFAMLIRARLLSLGIPVRFATVAVDPLDPGRFSHVYAVADCSDNVCGENWDGRVPLDTSHGPYPGWEVPNPYGKFQEWPGVSGWAVLAGVAVVAAGLWWWLKV